MKMRVHPRIRVLLYEVLADIVCNHDDGPFDEINKGQPD